MKQKKMKEKAEWKWRIEAENRAMKNGRSTVFGPPLFSCSVCLSLSLPLSVLDFSALLKFFVIFQSSLPLPPHLTHSTHSKAAISSEEAEAATLFFMNIPLCQSSIVKQKKQPKGRKEEGRKKESGRTKKEKKEMDGEQRTGTASQSAAASAIVTCPPTLPNTVTPSSAARMTGANGNVVHNPQTQTLIDISPHSHSWCQLPAYQNVPHTHTHPIPNLGGLPNHMMRSIDATPIEADSIERDHFSHDIEIQNSMGYHDLNDLSKYDMTMKYEMDDPQKEFEQTALYHKARKRMKISLKNNSICFQETSDIKQEEDTEEQIIQSEEKSAGQIEIGVKEISRGAYPAKRGRPTENPCWAYFIRIDDQNVRCKICQKIVKSACATNMTKHLERHHQHDYQHLILQIRQYRTLPSTAPRMTEYDTYTFQPAAVVDVFQRQSSADLSCSLSDDTSTWQLNHQWPHHWSGEEMNANAASSSSALVGGVVIPQGMVPWQQPSVSISPPTTNSPSPITEKPYMKRNRLFIHRLHCEMRKGREGTEERRGDNDNVNGNEAMRQERRDEWNRWGNAIGSCSAQTEQLAFCRVPRFFTLHLLKL
ncbi:hypothetical protein WR25_26211 [Diploscapter pachys]|uniref:BED-type domain-containing protein n=1 Tax=Diploscapter pachys TaxID=2018661 RepID=A0A2A2LMC7_9BILA|nr:hypothetical protein WR25_26211 [Diploscapter pachys]